MNYLRIVIAAICATIVYFLYGWGVYGVLIAAEYTPFDIYRSAADVMPYMPLGMAATFLAMLVLSLIYAKGYEGRGILEGARFGFLVSLFVVAAFVVHDFVILKIGARLAVAQALASIPEWTLVGVVIGLVYRPRAKAT
jgi:hypothetical protein